MNHGLKQRLVGAAVLTGLAIIFLPLLLDTSPQQAPKIDSTNIPPKPHSEFSSRIVPLDTAPPQVQVPEPPQAAQQASPSPQPSGADTGNGTAPAAAPEENAAVAPINQQRVGVTAWVVQLGSFSSEKNAEDLVAKLRKQGFNAFVEKLYSTDGTRYRVRVGPELVRDKAQATLDKLQKSLNLKGIVVRYP
jgi:DedD protein